MKFLLIYVSAQTSRDFHGGFCPTVAAEITTASEAIIADFESQDEIILEMIFGKFNPSGKLPIEIPSSVEAVNNQFEDVPYDSKDPLYKFGHGLSY